MVGLLDVGRHIIQDCVLISQALLRVISVVSHVGLLIVVLFPQFPEFFEARVRQLIRRLILVLSVDPRPSLSLGQDVLVLFHVLELVIRLHQVIKLVFINGGT